MDVPFGVPPRPKGHVGTIDLIRQQSDAMLLRAMQSDAFPPKSHSSRLLQFGMNLCSRGGRVITAAIELGDGWAAAIVARPCLEFCLRLLWAAQNDDGFGKMMHHYASQDDRLYDNLINYSPTMSDLKERLRQEAPLEALPKGMPYSMEKVIANIMNRDKEDNIPNVPDNPKDFYAAHMIFLHQWSHANPFHLSFGNDHNMAIAARAMLQAFLAAVRAWGYAFGWDQSLVARLVLLLHHFEHLDPEGEAQLEASRAELMQLLRRPADTAS